MARKEIGLVSSVTLQVVRADQVSPALLAEITALCSRAFEEDYAPFLATVPQPAHVLALLEGTLVSHALWVTRWLQQGHGPLLRAAYVEGMATEPALQGRGYGTVVMRRLAEEIRGYDLGALSTSSVAFYARLGWEPWRGPLGVRTAQGLLPCPEDSAMILRLSATPPLDLDGPLSVEWRGGEVW